MQTLKIKKLDPKAQIPQRAFETDAGLDLVAVSLNNSFSNGRLDYVEYGTGLAVEIPPGYVGLLLPRSSISLRRLAFANGVGVIDSSYRGEIKVRIRQVLESEPVYQVPFYEVGEKIAQLVISPIVLPTPEEVMELGSTLRGAGGFGSTGNFVGGKL